MKNLKRSSGFLYRIVLTMLALVMGASQGVLMADATPLPDAGKKMQVLLVLVAQTVLQLKHKDALMVLTIST